MLPSPTMPSMSHLRAPAPPLHHPSVHTVRRALVNRTLEGGRSRAPIAAPTRPQRFSERMGVPLRLGLPRQTGIILPSPLWQVPARCDTLRPRQEGRRTEKGKGTRARRHAPGSAGLSTPRGLLRVLSLA